MIRWLASLAALVMVAAACSSGESGASEAAAADRSGRPGDVEGDGSRAGVEPSIRDGDITDVDVLASRLAADATGEQEWIDVFAELRARSWLATRYPGHYDLAEIYVEEWAADHAEVLERESLDLGVYLDEPLPVLVSVVPTRELGALIELEVVLDAGEATIRRVADDTALGILPGGRHRGLFTLGHQDSSDRWRIHSVTELSVIQPEAGDTDQ